MQAVPKAADLVPIPMKQLGKESPLPVCKSRARLECGMSRQDQHEFSVPGIRDPALPERKDHVNLVVLHVVFRSSRCIRG
jgi:hypothetical protein